MARMEPMHNDALHPWQADRFAVALQVTAALCLQRGRRFALCEEAC